MQKAILELASACFGSLESPAEVSNNQEAEVHQEAEGSWGQAEVSARQAEKIPKLQTEDKVGGTIQDQE